MLYKHAIAITRNCTNKNNVCLLRANRRLGVKAKPLGPTSSDREPKGFTMILINDI